MKLIAITDDKHSVHELSSIILQIKDRIDFIHIREKSKTTKQLLKLLELLIMGNLPKEKIVMNNRLDVSLLMDIPNIHLPSYGLPVKKVKQKCPHFTVGQSVHTFKEATEAEADGADYVLYGHCFETKSKQGKTPNGLETLRQIKENLSIPVFAIGGITPERIHQLQRIRANGIAVMSGIFSASSPTDSTSLYYKKCKDNI
ncbi:MULTISPECIES: thiamine phosphate synthase [Bacillus]|uniref:thiamine phosphate synthase n=1 Tax=Bacillus TaxID=1386 RepID=UPI0002EE2AF6|nr:MULTISPECIES: thiamine phosphate synthase [Bacillus]